MLLNYDSPQVTLRSAYSARCSWYINQSGDHIKYIDQSYSHIYDLPATSYSKHQYANENMCNCWKKASKILTFIHGWIHLPVYTFTYYCWATKKWTQASISIYEI